LKRVGITGQNGFIGKSLSRWLGLYGKKYSIVECENYYFENKDLLYDFVNSCDVIVHLAGVNRHPIPEKIYEINLQLTQNLISSLNRSINKPQLIFASSSQEFSNTYYGSSKRDSRELFKSWAHSKQANFVGLIIPNVFGSLCKPFYNSVISTFCYQLVNDQTPIIIEDVLLELIYIDELIITILKLIDDNANGEILKFTNTTKISVSEVLNKLQYFKDCYLGEFNIPVLDNSFDINLFNTFRSFIPLGEFFPRKYVLNKDERGAFVELIKLGSGGQISFSSTMPGYTRGNHLHTRKIERFSVIKGSAQIQLKEINSDRIFEFRINDSDPGFVDIPIWFIHNIKNVSENELITVFWINEPYNPHDPDTFFIQN
jgi:UDP-2-acetamido-2,6-beta-L-arabino-hexul-4-ose reductase